jgi:gluconate 2-dehydrogenase gamma chain
MPSLYVSITRMTVAMNNNNELSRRRFLLSASALTASAFVRVTGASVVAIAQAACSARDNSTPFRSLSPEEAADIEAIAARIIPTTGTPGATEAGVVHFFDNAFAAEMKDSLEQVRAGIVHLNAAIGESSRFAALSPDAQDARLREIEHSDFFGLVREMTICGFFAMSDYGGNNGHVGWDLIGFKGHNGGWQYPFGYYDAQVHGGDGDGE